MIQLAKPESCSGCMACAAACPKEAVAIGRDSLGNIVPSVDPEQCIGCGACRKACPGLTPPARNASSRAYAVWSLDPQNRKTSASGGAASEFYARALADGYWICGAEYAADGRVVHTLTRDVDGIARFKQSKYVFSETGTVYRQIREKLDCGERVLMISLPCKIAGLLGYLKKPYPNLLTVDIVCHGTPSDQLLQEHVQSVCPGLGAYRLSFRADNEFIFRLEAGGKDVYRKIGRTDPYLAAFLEGLSYHPSCYQCAHARPQRVSDLTICDFWGLGAELPFDHPYTGSISAVLVNTSEGQAFFDCCRDTLFVEDRPVEEAVKGNAQLTAPTPVHPKRAEFESLHREHGFDQAVKTVLRDEMRAASRDIQRHRLRSGLRRIAGIFLKRYRG